MNPTDNCRTSYFIFVNKSSWKLKEASPDTYVTKAAAFPAHEDQGLPQRTLGQEAQGPKPGPVQGSQGGGLSSQSSSIAPGTLSCHQAPGQRQDTTGPPLRP